MIKHPLDQAIGEIFPLPPIESYPENMRAHVAKMRLMESQREEVRLRAARRRQLIGTSIAILSYASRAFLLLIGAALLAQATDRDSPMRTKVEIISPEVHAGDKLKMAVYPFRVRLCREKLIFQIWDGEGGRKTIDMDWKPPTGPLGADTPYARSIQVPSDAVPGPSRLRIERQFQCPLNIFHLEWPITTISPDMPFVTLPKAPP